MIFENFFLVRTARVSGRTERRQMKRSRHPLTQVVLTNKAAGHDVRVGHDVHAGQPVYRGIANASILEEIRFR